MAVKQEVRVQSVVARGQASTTQRTDDMADMMTAVNALAANLASTQAELRVAHQAITNERAQLTTFVKGVKDDLKLCVEGMRSLEDAVLHVGLSKEAVGEIITRLRSGLQADMYNATQGVLIGSIKPSDHMNTDGITARANMLDQADIDRIMSPEHVGTAGVQVDIPQDQITYRPSQDRHGNEIWSAWHAAHNPPTRMKLNAVERMFRCSECGGRAPSVPAGMSGIDSPNRKGVVTVQAQEDAVKKMQASKPAIAQIARGSANEAHEFMRLYVEQGVEAAEAWMAARMGNDAAQAAEDAKQAALAAYDAIRSRQASATPMQAAVSKAVLASPQAATQIIGKLVSAPPAPSKPAKASVKADTKAATHEVVVTSNSVQDAQGVLHPLFRGPQLWADEAYKASKEAGQKPYVVCKGCGETILTSGFVGKACCAGKGAVLEA